MRLDGARSATRKEPEGVTCATRVTRGTIDFQARDNLELRAGKALELAVRMRASRQGICKEISGAERWPTTPLPPNNYHPPSLVNVH